ncbi:MAG: hypothetical protein HC828_20465 [Blastochloris sp.]|nr:hypothetical protein [Blastochloris sp.]
MQLHFTNRDQLEAAYDAKMQVIIDLAPHILDDNTLFTALYDALNRYFPTDELHSEHQVVDLFERQVNS